MCEIDCDMKRLAAGPLAIRRSCFLPKPAPTCSPSTVVVPQRRHASLHTATRRRGYSTHPRPTSTKDVGKRVSILDLGEKHRKRIPLTMLTAKDFPSAVIIQQAGGIDLILVGDSMGMVPLPFPPPRFFVGGRWCVGAADPKGALSSDHHGLRQHHPCHHDGHAASCQVRVPRQPDLIPHR